RYFYPYKDKFKVNLKIDLFTLRSTIYFIMTSQEVFPDIVSREIISYFISSIFPNDPYVCKVITQKC
ncbi:hypothetical protein CC80DRAFT_424664, partial [Byssothecium circinans]